MKKTLIITTLSVVIVGLGVLAYLLFKPSNEITITFNSDGGTQVKEIKIKKEDSVHLPSTTKEGFVFSGWYLNNEKIDDTYKFMKNTTLTAKWEEAIKTFTVSFDSKGGSKVNDIILECGKELVLPIAPTKSGYTFTSWEDKNGRVINNNALFTCENITLYANWSAVTKTFKVNFNSDGGSSVKTITVECNKGLPTLATPTKSGYKFIEWQLNNKSVKSGTKLSCSDVTLKAKWEKNVTYTCPSGYTLNGTKCTTEKAASAKCSGDRVFDYNGKCVTITGSVRKDAMSSCESTTVHTGGGHTETVKGELFKLGTNFCFFKVVTDSYEQTQANCTSRGHFWNSQNSKCYYYRGNANQFVTSTCSHLSNYAYITNPNTYNGVNGLNGGCFPLSEKTKSCESGYTLSNNKCIKTIDATAK